jgi:hypothetical protein
MHRTSPCPEQAPRELLPVLGRQVQLSDLIGQFTSLAHELGLQVVPILARAVIAGKRTDDVDDREVPLLLLGARYGRYLLVVEDLAGIVDGHFLEVECTR